MLKLTYQIKGYPHHNLKAYFSRMKELIEYVNKRNIEEYSVTCKYEK